MKNTIELFCDRHKIKFKGKVLLGGIKIGCPECKKEAEQAQKQRIDYEARLREREALEYKEFRIKYSGLPKSLIEIKAKYIANFKEHSAHLMSLESNLFLCGGVGTGKSVYCAELIKRNTEKCPRYYNASDLSYLSNSQKAGLLKGIENCTLFVIDEISNLSSIDEQFLNALVDKLYNQGAYFVLCGNVDSSFLNSLSTKILSRLNANGLNVCEFAGDDLRIKK